MFAEKQARNRWFPIALIPRTAGGGVSTDDGDLQRSLDYPSRRLLRRLLRTRVTVHDPDFEDRITASTAQRPDS